MIFFNAMNKYVLLSTFSAAIWGAISGCSSEFALPYQQTDFSQVSDKVYVRLPAEVINQEFIKSTGFIRDHKSDKTFAFGYIERQRLPDLPDHMHQQLVELDESWIHYDFDPLTLAYSESSKAISEDYFDGYHNYAALTSEMERLAANYSDIMSLHSAGKSVEGRELWYMKVTKDPEAGQDHERPKFLYVANMHGDEVVGRELMIYLLRQFAEEYQTNSRISQLVNHAQIFIMPSMNPDGFERRQRWNRHGSDLNRNFPDFTSDPQDVSKGRQPETQALMALHDAHHFVGALNFHGGAVCFNMPWDTQSNKGMEGRFGDDGLMRMFAHEYAETNPTMRENNSEGFDRGVTYGYEWYEVDGGMQDWANYYRQSFHATIELSDIKWPSSRYLSHYWQENQEGLIAYLEHMLMGFHFDVIDEETNMRVKQPVHISNSGAERQVNYRYGMIHRPARGDRQSVVIESEGYQPLVIEDQQPWLYDGNLVPILLKR